MSINKMYDSWSASYDSDRNLTRDLAGMIMRNQLAGTRGDTIIEAGCGTGGNTFFLASVCDNLIALDFSEGMLNVLRGKLSSQHSHCSIQIHQCDLTQQWPVVDSVADVIVCALVLEHINRLSPVYEESYRVLKPGGSFLIYELHPVRQILGGRATFTADGHAQEIPAFIHTIEQFREGADRAGFKTIREDSQHHPEDVGKPPRILVQTCTK